MRRGVSLRRGPGGGGCDSPPPCKSSAGGPRGSTPPCSSAPPVPCSSNKPFAPQNHLKSCTYSGVDTSLHSQNGAALSNHRYDLTLNFWLQALSMLPSRIWQARNMQNRGQYFMKYQGAIYQSINPKSYGVHAEAVLRVEQQQLTTAFHAEMKRVMTHHMTSALGYLRISRMTKSKGKGASCSMRTIATSPCLFCFARSSASS